VTTQSVERGASGAYVSDTTDATVRIEMGRGLMWARELASLGPGAMVQLQTLCDQLVDVYAGGKLIARGELVCLDGNFAVRVREVSGQWTVGSGQQELITDH
jgi:flagellar motor switch protein FliN/FliY